MTFEQKYSLSYRPKFQLEQPLDSNEILLKTFHWFDLKHNKRIVVNSLIGLFVGEH
jgi:hypothetical protein